MNQYLKLKIDGKRIEAKRAGYVTAKTKQLREFGYSTLTELEVDAQVSAILEKKETDIIGKFMEDEVIGLA